MADERQRRAFDQRVVLQAREEPGWQRLGQEGAAVRVPVRHGREHPLFQLVQGGKPVVRGDPDPGQQPQPRRIRQQVDHRPMAE